MSIDFKLVDYGGENGVVLDGDVYVGGVDTGYANTKTNNLPYGYADGFVALSIEDVDKCGDLTQFRNHVFDKAVAYVNSNSNKTLAEKMNMDNLFDWS